MVFFRQKKRFAWVDTARSYGVDMEGETAKKEADRSNDRRSDRTELLSPDELRCLDEWLDTDQRRSGD